MKSCCSCKESKPFGDFGKNRSTKDGLQKWCKTCRSLAQGTKYKDKTIERVNAWVKNNPDKRRHNAREYYHRHPEIGRRLSAATPEYVKVCQIEQMLISDCYSEAKRLTTEFGTSYHVDHIVPLAAGGTHESSNLQVLPAKTNLSKGSVYEGVRYRRNGRKVESDSMLMLVFDFETTGLEIEDGAEPIELAAIMVNPDKATPTDPFPEVARFPARLMRVQHPEKAHWKALQVNGKTIEQVMAGEDPRDVFADFVDWIQRTSGGKKVRPAGHNVQFDMKFLRWAFREYLAGMNIESVLDYHVVCSFNVAYFNKVLGDKSIAKANLGALTKHYNIPHVAHEAMGDVEATVEVFRRLFHEVTGRNLLAAALAVPAADPDPAVTSEPPVDQGAVADLAPAIGRMGTPQTQAIAPNADDPLGIL